MSGENDIVVLTLVTREADAGIDVTLADRSQIIIRLALRDLVEMLVTLRLVKIRRPALPLSLLSRAAHDCSWLDDSSRNDRTLASGTFYHAEIRVACVALTPGPIETVEHYGRVKVTTHPL